MTAGRLCRHRSSCSCRPRCSVVDKATYKLERTKWPGCLDAIVVGLKSMSLIYSVLKTTDEVNDWLKSWDVAVTPIKQPSRYPTPREISDVLNSSAELSAEYLSTSTGWQIDITEGANLDKNAVRIVIP